MPNTDSPKARIAHIGFGAFHRAHQAIYTQLANNLSEEKWGICEISLYSNTGIERLRENEHQYSVLEIDDESSEVITVNAACEGLTPKLNSCDEIIAKLAHKDIEVVSLTITEKGYCTLPSSMQVDWENPDIKHDLKSIDTPITAIGYMVAALQKRRKEGLTPFTVLSCDNLPNNGDVARCAILQLSQKIDPELASWIEQYGAFPSTMVDRIVPAMTDDSHKQLEKIIGRSDPCGIVCEPFKQWVIEDKFAGQRPSWEKAGAQIVNEVSPFEEMKLRLLNGSHSFIAYLGYLAGYRTVSETVADPEFKKATLILMKHYQVPTLRVSSSFNIQKYIDSLIKRFENSYLKHKTYQIAMDGSQKIPQRWLAPLRILIDRNEDITLLALAIASWLRYIMGEDEQGETIHIQDPLSAEFKNVIETHGINESAAEQILLHSEIFPPELVKNDELRKTILSHFSSLNNNGVKSTLTDVLNSLDY